MYMYVYMYMYIYKHVVHIISYGWMLQFYTRFAVLLPVICGVQLVNQVHIASLSSGPSLPGAWLPTRWDKRNMGISHEHLSHRNLATENHHVPRFCWVETRWWLLIIWIDLREICRKPGLRVPFRVSRRSLESTRWSSVRQLSLIKATSNGYNQPKANMGPKCAAMDQVMRVQFAPEKSAETTCLDFWKQQTPSTNQQLV
jgi:hypothetical protein